MAHKEGQQIDTLPAQMYGWNGSSPVKVLLDIDGNMVSISKSYATQIDDVSTVSVAYVGKAAVGSATSSPVWQIIKISKGGSPISTIITYADGNSNFDNIFDNRTSLTYS